MVSTSGRPGACYVAACLLAGWQLPRLDFHQQVVDNFIRAPHTLVGQHYCGSEPLPIAEPTPAQHAFVRFIRSIFSNAEHLKQVFDVGEECLQIKVFVWDGCEFFGRLALQQLIQPF